MGVKRVIDAICLDFINSESRDFHGRWVRDDLQQPGWFEQFLIKWGLVIDQPPDAATLSTLIAPRTLLRSLTEALGEELTANHDYSILLKMPLNRRLVKDQEGYRLDMVPLKKDWDWVQAEIAASFAHVLAYHNPKRLKICANTNCRGGLLR